MIITITITVIITITIMTSEGYQMTIFVVR